MPLTFTREQAHEILAQKNLTPEQLRDLLASKPLKTVAKEYKIGHVRLSACAHALKLFTVTKEEKISQSLARRGTRLLLENQEKSDISQILQDLQNSTLPQVASKHKVSVEWLSELAAKNHITPLTNQKVRQKTGLRRKQQTEQRLLSQKEELLACFQRNLSAKKIAQQFNTSVEVVRRLASQIYPEYLSKQVTADRKKIGLSNGGRQARSSSLDKAHGADLRLSYQKTDEELWEYVCVEMNSHIQLAEELGIPAERCRYVIEQRLNLEIKNDTPFLMHKIRNILKNAINIHDFYYDWLDSFLIDFNFEVPRIFQEQSRLYAFCRFEEKKEHVDWFLRTVQPVDKEDMAKYLPGYTPTKVFYLLKKMYPELLETFTDKNGKQRTRFMKGKDPLPPQSAKTRENRRKHLVKQFTTETGLKAVEDAYKNAKSLTDLDASLQITAAERYFLVKENILPNKKFSFSRHEISVKKVLDSLMVEYQAHVKGCLPNKYSELDFFLPSLNLAVEVNPTFTHNSTYGWGYKEANALHRNYHYNKVQASRKAGITTIMLYEKDLLEPNFSNITEPLLEHKILGYKKVLYAREVELRRVSSPKDLRTARDFLSKYHAQGAGKANHYYLFLEKRTEELVGVASFSKNNHLVQKETHFELKRLAFLPGVQVRFGISKLVNRFFTDFPEEKDLHSYSRNDMGEGQGYKAAGFTLIRELKPTPVYVNPVDPYDSYSWSINSEWSAKTGVLSRFFTPEQLKEVPRRELITKYLPRRTGNQLGYVEVYNSGNRLWRINNPNFE